MTAGIRIGLARGLTEPPTALAIYLSYFIE